MFDYRKIQDEVLTYLDDFAGSFDVDGIMDELRAIEPDVQSLDDVDPDTWLDIIQRHDSPAR